jgi:hypothetical protein
MKFRLVLKLEISYNRVINNILKDFFGFLLEEFLKIIYFLNGEIFEFP